MDEEEEAGRSAEEARRELEEAQRSAEEDEVSEEQLGTPLGQLKREARQKTLAGSHSSLPPVSEDRSLTTSEKDSPSPSHHGWYEDHESHPEESEEEFSQGSGGPNAHRHFMFHSDTQPQFPRKSFLSDQHFFPTYDQEGQLSSTDTPATYHAMDENSPHTRKPAPLRRSSLSREYSALDLHDDSDEGDDPWLKHDHGLQHTTEMVKELVSEDLHLIRPAIAKMQVELRQLDLQWRELKVECRESQAERSHKDAAEMHQILEELKVRRQNDSQDRKNLEEQLAQELADVKKRQAEVLAELGVEDGSCAEDAVELGPNRIEKDGDLHEEVESIREKIEADDMRFEEEFKIFESKAKTCLDDDSALHSGSAASGQADIEAVLLDIDRFNRDMHRRLLVVQQLQSGTKADVVAVSSRLKSHHSSMEQVRRGHRRALEEAAGPSAASHPGGRLGDPILQAQRRTEDLLRGGMLALGSPRSSAGSHREEERQLQERRRQLETEALARGAPPKRNSGVFEMPSVRMPNSRPDNFKISTPLSVRRATKMPVEAISLGPSAEGL